MSQLYTSKKKYDEQMAAGFIAYVGMSEFFGSCRCSSGAIESMYLHYAEMTEKRREALKPRVWIREHSFPVSMQGAGKPAMP